MAPGAALAVKVISISVSAAISPVTFEVFGLAATAYCLSKKTSTGNDEGPWTHCS